MDSTRADSEYDSLVNPKAAKDLSQVVRVILKNNDVIQVCMPFVHYVEAITDDETTVKKHPDSDANSNDTVNNYQWG